MLIAVALYFLLACLASWLLFFPAGRGYVQQRWARMQAATLPGLGGFARRHYLLCLGGVLLLSVPPLLAWLAGGKNMLDGFDVSTREMNTQVASLLQGEQLAPPVALPPAVFVRAEVEQERPLLVSASRNWELLDRDFTQRLLLVFKIMKEQHGYEMALLEGYRSPERQQLLARMGAQVTSAAAFQSWHQYGLAADCAFLRDGKLVISEQDPWAMRGYQLFGQVAESAGLTWGGRWKMMDFGHTELRVPGVMKSKG